VQHLTPLTSITTVTSQQDHQRKTSINIKFNHRRRKHLSDDPQHVVVPSTPTETPSQPSYTSLLRSSRSLTLTDLEDELKVIQINLSVNYSDLEK